MARVALSCLALLAFAAPARAQVTMGVETVQGRGAGVARAELESQIDAAAEATRTEASEAQVRIRARLRGSQITIQAVDAEGTELAIARFRGRNAGSLRRRIRDGFWSEVGAPAVAAVGGGDEAPPAEAAATEASSAPPADPYRGDVEEEVPEEPAAEPAPPASNEDRAPAPAPASSDGAGPDAFRGTVGLGLYSRDFSYVDDVFLALRGYRLPAVPMLRVGVTWHPLAHAMDELWASIFGLVVDVQVPFGLATEVADIDYPTHALAWSTGLRARLPFDAHAIAVSGSYAERSFAIGAPSGGQPRPDVPDVHYHEIRVDAQLWLDFDVVAFAVRGGWGFVVESGGVETEGWFRKNRSHGATAGLEVQVPIFDGLNVVGAFDWTGYFFDMNAEPGDARVAGGALDLYYAATLGLGYRTR